MKLHEIAKEQFLTDRADIEYWLVTKGIRNYTVNVNGEVDVDGPVSICNKTCPPILPIKFGEVIGSFDCFNNGLTSLVGCPHTVGGYFDATNNKLTSLHGCPSNFRGSWAATNFKGNNITSLVGISDLIVNANQFSCDWNKITSGGIGLLLIPGLMLAGGSSITRWLQIINYYFGKPDDIFECQAELIEDGLDAFAVL